MAGPLRWNPLHVLAGQGNCSSGQPARNWGSLASGWGGFRTPAAPAGLREGKYAVRACSPSPRSKPGRTGLASKARSGRGADRPRKGSGPSGEQGWRHFSERTGDRAEARPQRQRGPAEKVRGFRSLPCQPHRRPHPTWVQTARGCGCRMFRSTGLRCWISDCVVRFGSHCS